MTTMSKVQFEKEPFQERYSHLLGNIQLYAPAVEVSEYGQHPWLLVTQHGWEGMDSERLRYEIKPECIKHCWNHIAVIDSQHLWVD